MKNLTEKVETSFGNKLKIKRRNRRRCRELKKKAALWRRKELPTIAVVFKLIYGLEIANRNFWGYFHVRFLGEND